MMSNRYEIRQPEKKEFLFFNLSYYLEQQEVHCGL